VPAQPQHPDDQKHEIDMQQKNLAKQQSKSDK
jgi:hypothetical protein